MTIAEAIELLSKFEDQTRRVVILCPHCAKTFQIKSARESQPS